MNNMKNYDTTSKTPRVSTMRDLMCMMHRYSKAADTAFMSAFRTRPASTPPPAIRVTEAPTSAMPPRRPASRRANSAISALGADPRRDSTSSSRPSICHDELTRGDMYEALEAIAAALPAGSYALIGGVACLLLGHTRGTKDIDIVVPDGEAPRAAQLLARSPKFGTERMASGRCRCWFNAASRRHHNVDVLEPRDIGQRLRGGGAGDGDGAGVLETVLVANRPVLAPAQLLNYKVAGWTDRMGTTGYKKINHARDILFLAGYLAKQGMRVDREEVYHATEDFLVMFCGSYPEARPLFETIGLARRGSSSKLVQTKVSGSERSSFKSGGLLSP
jgi:hypothetical protein